MTALERNPEHRWQRASALRNALAAEIKRLGLSVRGHQVVEWLEQAFRGAPEDSEPDISIHGGTASMAVGSASTPPQPEETAKLRRADSEAMKTLVRSSASISITPGARTPRVTRYSRRSRAISSTVGYSDRRTLSTTGRPSAARRAR